MMADQDKSRLAINGGRKAVTTPLSPRGLMTEAEKQAVMSWFDRSISTGTFQGYNGEEEEGYCHEMAQFMGGGFADAVNSGTNALYVALRALNPEPFSEIIVPPLTDPGGMMPVPLLNCIPVVADAEPGCYNTGPSQIEALISPLTSAIVVAHIGGEPADSDAIVRMAHAHGIPVVEDCAQAHGATLNGRKVGSFGDISAFSTMFGKHHCTGGQGGVVFTRHEDLFHRVKQVADRGKPFFRPQGSSNDRAALNCNLDEVACAIGRVQLARLPDIVASRQRFADTLRPGFEALPSLRVPPVIPGGEHVYWWWRLEVAQDQITVSKQEYCAALAAEGVDLNPDYSAAMPQFMEWFEQRRVFGTSQLPWSSPSYRGDANRRFPCPHAKAAVASQFNMTILESWGDREAEQLLKAFRKVDMAYRC